MKRRTSGLLAAVVIVMVLTLGVGSALAAMAAPYYSWCTADANVSSDFGDSHAYAYDNPSGYYASAESIAIAWGLGARAHVYVNDYFASDAYAHAEFTQLFEVTAAGTASIDFSYDGWLSAENLSSGTVGGMYGVSFSVDASDDLGNSGGDSFAIDSLGEDSPTGAFSFNYVFSTDDIGSTFAVTLMLDADITAEDIQYDGDGGADFWSDFYNTAEITGTSGGISPLGGPPVPLPGAIWLLGSGLFGLVVVRRKRNV